MKKLLAIVLVLMAALNAMADDNYNRIINSPVYTAALEDLAEKGDILAQNNLGVMYLVGSGTEKNLDKALYWFVKAAEGGRASAMVNIGAMYLKGNGVEADPKAAAEWFQKAADMNDQAGLYNLALLYLGGTGVEKDLVKAFEYAKKAADDVNMTSIHEKETGMTAKHSVWASAELLTAKCYGAGIGTTADQALAMKYLERAAKHRSYEANMLMSKYYESGEGGKPDPDKALEYSRRAEEIKAAKTK